jgi:hypothetical protein
LLLRGYTVNADFSSVSKVDDILDQWKDNPLPAGPLEMCANIDAKQALPKQGAIHRERLSVWKETSIMFRRSVILILRDREFLVSFL